MRLPLYCRHEADWVPDSRDLEEFLFRFGIFDQRRSRGPNVLAAIAIGDFEASEYQFADTGDPLGTRKMCIADR